MKESLEKAIFPGFTRNGNSNTASRCSFNRRLPVRNRYQPDSARRSRRRSRSSRSSATCSDCKKDGFVTAGLAFFAGKGNRNKTPFVIIVRQGNPKGIHDFSDLAKPGIR
jgi:hypothetical protein